ncbi:hypothetical protein SeMB42_g06846 [Synchytrium endobioticum]|uniref:Uncharacterized protein n=1 Tax=Synchytrium endobioticum TaxID=286115 RepID=A0A507CI55_9FUNG|nr:hypothetical protein SeMB42_g06846 [Synchytrium endobioticum]TPX39638.1 hypothetical protein SeLEV6574_g07081 [Synchytrium endobioticum]
MALRASTSRMSTRILSHPTLRASSSPLCTTMLRNASITVSSPSPSSAIRMAFAASRPAMPSPFAQACSPSNMSSLTQPAAPAPARLIAGSGARFLDASETTSSEETLICCPRIPDDL